MLGDVTRHHWVMNDSLSLFLSPCVYVSVHSHTMVK